MKILYVTYGLPYPPNSGVRIHDFNMIKQVSKSHSVFVLSLLYDDKEIQWLPELRKFCDSCDVVLARKRSPRQYLAEFVRGFFSGRPLACHPFIYVELKQKIRQTLESEQIKIIQIEHSFLAPYIEAIPTGHPCKRILSFQNLGSRQYKSMMQMRLGLKEKLLFFLKFLLMRRWEAAYAEKFDNCLVVSKKEGEILGRENPALKITVVENGVDTNLLRPLPESPKSKTLLFVGTMSYPPNTDAILDFCQSTLSLIRKQIPDVKLLVVGHGPPTEIAKLAEDENIVVTGEVGDLKLYYEQSQVVIVPLRAGAGTRLKILEAMALGRPVVSTPFGCEGLNVKHEQDILIAETPYEFAKQVINLVNDSRCWSRIARGARERVESGYDSVTIGKKFLQVYDEILTENRESKVARNNLVGETVRTA